MRLVDIALVLQAAEGVFAAAVRDLDGRQLAAPAHFLLLERLHFHLVPAGQMVPCGVALVGVAVDDASELAPCCVAPFQGMVRDIASLRTEHSSFVASLLKSCVRKSKTVHTTYI
jgi:hypothetical protein